MLPGLTPAHTRTSFHNASRPESGGARLSIEKIVSSPADFLKAEESGLWLLPPEVASQDVAQDIVRASWLINNLTESGDAKDHLRDYQQIARLLDRSSVSESGCVERGLRGKQTPAATVIRLANFETRSVTHNNPADVVHLSLCGNADCYNTRHHNLDFGGVRHDLQRVGLNPFWYVTQNDGTIRTIWGDQLPSLDESLGYFMAFQRMNFPFVPYKDSLLTTTPMSQIGFHPLTGCWEASMYEKNTSGLANYKNGYGVMYARQSPDLVHPGTGEITRGYRRGTVLAHNLIWEVSGRTLTTGMERNHLCNYTRCCNPLHINEITPDENRRHGHDARRRIRELESERPETKGHMLSKAELAQLYSPVRQRYAEISVNLDT